MLHRSKRVAGGARSKLCSQFMNSALTTETEEAPKHSRVRELLMAAIRAGEFAPGEQLPGERDLAARYAVSYMTARRAITEMVEADLLERRPNKGTYVRAQGSRRLAGVTINLIYPLQLSSFGDQFLQSAIMGTQKRGWHYHLVPLQTGRERSAVRALDHGEPAILMTPGLDEASPLYQAVARAQGRVVTIGGELGGHIAPAVMADDALAVRLIMEHLRRAGHRAIGFITKNLTHPIEQERIATWKECCAPAMTPTQIERRLIELNDLQPRQGISHTHLIYAALSAKLACRDLDVTALICSGDSTALATLAACRANGYAVPAEMSVVTIGDSPIMEFCNPPLTCVDVHVGRHVERALEVIEATLGGAPSPQKLRLIEPTLIERATVAAPFEVKAADTNR